MAAMFYVLDLRKGWVTHQDTKYEPCLSWIIGASQFGARRCDFAIAHGAKERDRMLANRNDPTVM